MVDEDYDYSLLSSQSAMDFIKEVEAIPNDTTEADGPFALKIDMEYKDPDGTTHPVIKTMYGALPENWDTIVKLANELTMQRMEIPVSKKITVVNGNYLREYHPSRRMNIRTAFPWIQSLKNLESPMSICMMKLSVFRMATWMYGHLLASIHSII